MRKSRGLFPFFIGRFSHDPYRGGRGDNLRRLYRLAWEIQAVRRFGVRVSSLGNAGVLGGVPVLRGGLAQD